MANIIRDSAFALLAVINDILDFSKIEAGKLQIDNVPMCVTNVVEKVCEIMDRMALKMGVELTLFTDPAIPAEVLGDPGRLRQILINLVSNAIKFSSIQKRPGRVSIRALLGKRHGERLTLEFQVADNGIGIDAATLARLFSPFIQADTSTTRGYGGTGLGLAISRQLANIMEGEISVSSEPGKGSLFNMRISFALPTEHGAQDLSRHVRSDIDPNLVEGLPCLVADCPDGMGGDLVSYLIHDKALVQRATDLASAQQWIASRSSGRSIVIIDTRIAGSSLDELCVTARSNPASDTHFVLIGRGPRSGPRVDSANMVSLNGNLLTRLDLLNAVGIAAGRVNAPVSEGIPVNVEVKHKILSIETVRRRGSLILVAEDNDINQNVILHQLALLGYVADLAVDGREALAKWHLGNHALLLTDLHMPEMDGYELTAAIRQTECEGRHLPIVALTANALKSEEIHCKAVGMDDYLSKPVLLDRLQAMLEKWLPMPAAEESTAGVFTQPANDGLAILDTAVLAELVGADPALVEELLSDYRRSVLRAAEEIRSALALGQRDAACNGAHKLKSSSRSVGAMALGDVCARLEQAGVDVDADTAQSLTLEFEKSLAAVLAALHQRGR
jgi:CheY-like chemotaxis protein/HPt (histidine-containing phosphotransfer) domain-containing protein